MNFEGLGYEFGPPDGKKGLKKAFFRYQIGLQANRD